jgi:hypothetical protein
MKVCKIYLCLVFGFQVVFVLLRATCFSAKFQTISTIQSVKSSHLYTQSHHLRSAQKVNGMTTCNVLRENVGVSQSEVCTFKHIRISTNTPHFLLLATP